MPEPAASSDSNSVWDQVATSKEFQDLMATKRIFIVPAFVFFVVYYFLLPIGAAYFQDLFRVRVWGVINFGLLFALSEFVVAWLVAWYYARRAGGEFDRLAAEIAAEAARSKGV